jgi:hyperosmotically inducible protein
MKNLSRNILVVSSLALASLGLNGCIAAAAGAGAEVAYVATQEDRSTSETLTDQRITSTVKTALLANQQVSGFDINVDTFKAVVTLRGFVDNRKEADKAVQLAAAVSGVKEVKTNLIIK